MQEHHLTIERTARFHTLGDPATARAVWVVLHGYGQLARYFLRPFEGLERDLLIVAPEASSRFYIDPDHARVGASWMTREDREHEIVDQVAHGDRLVARVNELCGGERPLSILGFSQGVATACRWSVLGRTRYQRVVLWGGTMPPELSTASLRKAWAQGRVDVVHGTQDDLVPVETAQRTATTLRDVGVEHRLHLYEGGHAIDPLLLKQLLTNG